jgi:ABC-2 type transport system permease protein
MTGPLQIIGLFFMRDLAIARSYRFAFAFDALTTVANVAVFFFLSKLIAPAALGDDQDLSEGYFGFAVVGLALLGMADSGISAFAGQLRTDQTTGTVEALAATPPPFSLLVASSGAYPIARAGVTAAATLGVAAIGFGFRPDIDLAGAGTCALVLVGMIAFTAGIGLAIAAATLLLKQTARLTALASIALTVFSGAYYPLDVLPQPIEAVASAVPITWGIEAVRAALLGGDVSEVKVVALIFAGAGSVAVSLLAVELSARRAKRRGTLTSY